MSAEELLLRKAFVSGSALIYWAGVLIQARRVRKKIGRSPNLTPRSAKERMLWLGWLLVVATWIGGTRSRYGAAIRPMPCAASVSGRSFDFSEAMISRELDQQPLCLQETEPANAGPIDPDCLLRSTLMLRERRERRIIGAHRVGKRAPRAIELRAQARIDPHRRRCLR